MEKYIVTYVDLTSGGHCTPYAFTTAYDSREAACEAVIDDMEECADDHDELDKDRFVLNKADGTVIVWNINVITID